MHTRHIAAFALLTACGDGVSSEAEAEAAYRGLDPAIGDILRLGFDGFNAASSANIPEQQAPGPEDGTLVVSGQVDQGSSDNKGMRLDVALTDWYAGPVTVSDDDEDADLDVWYTTAAPLQVDLSLRDMPAGSLSGTVQGAVEMGGDLEGTVSLSLSLDGTTEDDGSGGAQRVEGATHVTGTATSDYGTYDIDLTL